MIHSTAVIDESAKISPDAVIGPGVVVGAYAIIGPKVEIGEGTEIAAHAVIKKNCIIGKHNKIHSFVSLADDPQDIHYKGQESWLHIGDHNIIREFSTIHRSAKEGGITSVGDHNFIMCYAHIAHDCKIANHVVFANNATVGGHVNVSDHATLGGSALVHQNCNVGAYSFVGGASALNQDVLPYVMVHGVPAHPIAVNIVGLRRHGFSKEVIDHIRSAYRILFRRGYGLMNARAELEKMALECKELELMLEAIDKSTRGIAMTTLGVDESVED